MEQFCGILFFILLYIVYIKTSYIPLIHIFQCKQCISALKLFVLILALFVFIKYILFDMVSSLWFCWCFFVRWDEFPDASWKRKSQRQTWYFIVKELIVQKTISAYLLIAGAYCVHFRISAPELHVSKKFNIVRFFIYET